MVNVSSQQGIIFKLKEFLLHLWALLYLFVASLFNTNPKATKRDNSNPFSSWGRGNGGGGGPGRPGGSGGPGNPRIRTLGPRLNMGGG